MAEIRLRGLRKNFGDVKVIHGVNLTVKDALFVLR